MAGVGNYLNGWNDSPQWAGILGNATPQMMMDAPSGSSAAAAPQSISPAPDETAADADTAGNVPPPPSAVPSGNWWKTDNADGTTSFLGGLLSYDPAKDIGRNDRLGMIGAGLSDIAAQMSGHPEAATSLDKYAMQNKLASFQQQMTQAGDDPVKVRKALVNYASLGGDPMPGRVAAPGAINIHPAKLYGGP